MSSPIERLFDSAAMKCTICAAEWGTCSCWSRHHCGWFYRTDGGSCRNPDCRTEGTT